MVQVKKEHYFFKNVKPHRFQLYWWVIHETVKLRANSVLEIGPGQGIVTHVLRFNGIHTVTADFDVNLSPSVSCDVRLLPFQSKSFDVVIASEVLEHIPYDFVDSTIEELLRCGKKGVIISVPYNQHHVEVYLNLKVNKYLGFKGFVNKLIDT